MEGLIDSAIIMLVLPGFVWVNLKNSRAQRVYRNPFYEDF